MDELDKYLAEVRERYDGAVSKDTQGYNGLLITENVSLARMAIPNLLAIIEAQAKVVKAGREVWHGDDSTSFQRKLEVLKDAIANHDARVKEVLDGN